MGTRSAIGVMHGDKVKAVYCHWDGYLEHNGKILQESYDSPKTNELVSMGNMSSLGAEIGEKHPFDNPYDFRTPEYEAHKAKYGDMCTFYGRDREEEDQEYIVVESAKEMFNKFSWCEFFYVMKDGVWYVSEGAEWRLLTDALADLKEEA